MRQAALDLAEAALELAAGAAQRLLGIGVEAAGEVHDREQQVADLVGDAIGRGAAVDLAAQLGDLLLDLGEDRRRRRASRSRRARRGAAASRRG